MNQLYKDLNKLYDGRQEGLEDILNVKFSIDNCIPEIIHFFNNGYWTM